MSEAKTTKKKPATEKDVWYKDGIQFECQGSGQCCVSHGEYGFVYVTAADRKRMAKLRGIPTSEFTRTFCLKEEGLFRLRDGAPINLNGGPAKPTAKPCVFLENKRCTIYAARPAQCRTWPFWPETMSAKAWTKDVAKFCPGVGKGRVWPREEIDALLKEQAAWEDDLAHGL
ncbi:YkgJ family cysteine cluster protein [soil metagenome]